MYIYTYRRGHFTANYVRHSHTSVICQMMFVVSLFSSNDKNILTPGTDIIELITNYFNIFDTLFESSGINTVVLNPKKHIISFNASKLLKSNMNTFLLTSVPL